MRLLSSLLFTSLTASLLGAYGLTAQEPDLSALPASGDELVDRVVAVVGDSAIFRSQVEEHLLRLQAAGTPLPQEEEALRQLQRNTLNELVSQSLVLQAAAEDTLIAVSESRIESTLQDAWNDEVQRFGSEAALRQALSEAGTSVGEYRSQLRENLSRQLLMQSYMQMQRGQARPSPVEESEIREFYERERANIGDRPATLSFRQTVLLPSPSEEAMAAARDEAERILEMLRDGEEFEDLARRFSDDPGSGQRGGELGWTRRGSMVQEFEDVAFRLNRGQTSGVVESSFGMHIIRVERIRSAERMLRHILIAPEITDADVQSTRERAAVIRAEVEAGTPMEEFANESEQTGLPDTLTLAMNELNQLPGGYAAELSSASAGDVLGPIEFQTPQGQPAFAVIHVSDVRDEGAYTYEDVREQIRQILEEDRFESQLVERLRDRTHVDIRW